MNNVRTPHKNKYTEAYYNNTSGSKNREEYSTHAQATQRAYTESAR